MAAAHIEDTRAGANAGRGDAVFQHGDLRFFGRVIGPGEEAMMDMVAPECAIDEGERVVMLAHLRGADGEGGAGREARVRTRR